MIRTFDEHFLRQTQMLNKQWDFILDPDDQGVAEQWFSSFPAKHEQLYVPSCWNNELNKFEYEGVAWYRTIVKNVQPEHLRLVFHGILGHADVYWDGRHLGYHYGGYSPFEFVLAHQSEGDHELIIRTDSRLDQTTIPYEVVDWFHYGGMIRPVEVQRLNDVFIQKMNFSYEMTSEAEADIFIKIKLQSLVNVDCELPLRLESDGTVFFHEQVNISAGKVKVIEIKQSWNEIRRWHVGTPELYTIYAVAGNDDLTDRIGFRTVETINGKIILNGEEIYLQGVNRHEEHPEWGFAFPSKLMSKDLDIIENAGCNTVRGSHYPQSKYWIDLLDERGMLFWSEIPIWGAWTPTEALAEPVFIDRAITMMGEMIDRDIHHPSIIFWSAHNEIDTRSQEAYELSVRLTDLARTKDTSRLITYATMYPLEDICMPLFDVIGINKYYGWYEGEVDNFRPMLKQFHARAEQLGVGERPVLMTEFGAAGIYGDTGWEPRLFSEDYQAHVLEGALTIFREDPKISGTYIWQFADVRGSTRSDRTNFRDRARSFNNKGIINEYRKPKLAYRIVKEIYSQQSRSRNK